MEQNRESKNKPKFIWSNSSTTKEAKIYNGEKTVSSINDVGKTDSYM